MKFRTWSAAVGLALGGAVFLSGCDDDDDHHHFDETDIVGRMLLPGMSPAAGASCELFYANLSYGIVFADPNGFFEFPDWPEELEPILVRGTYVQAGTGTTFQGASPLVGTSNDGDTDLGDIILNPVPGDAFRGAPEGLASAGIAFSDPDGDGRLDLVFLDPATGTPRAVAPGN